MRRNPDRLKRTLGAVAVAAGLGLGAAGVANALSGGGQPTTPTTAAETADAQGPGYTSSVQVPESTTENDQAEAAALQAATKISPDQAKQAALAAVPGGTAGTVDLESENGNVVYAVEVTANGTTTDVKVDAGNGSVLAQETDQKEGTDGAEAGGEAPDSGPEAPAGPAAPAAPGA
jgi:uncharacterized membrane protein YkoI